MSGCRVFVGHLSSRARERDVEKFFKGYGRIREIHLKNGFGFVVSNTLFSFLLLAGTSLGSLMSRKGGCLRE